jgi:hypothetical protein
MERVRSSQPPEGFVAETIEPWPPPPTLATQIEAVRSPAVTVPQVDALLSGLSQPLPEGESPRSRADLLLALIEAGDVDGLQGTDGRSVQGAAVKALLDLGYPYALEVPPEALAKAQSSAGASEPVPRDIPFFGIGMTLFSLLIQSFQGLPLGADIIGSGGELSIPAGLFVIGTVLGPSCSALLGGWLRLRALQSLGVTTMGIVGFFWLAAFCVALLLGIPAGEFYAVALLSGLSMMTGAILLRHPEWLPKPSPEASPQLLEAQTPRTP